MHKAKKKIGLLIFSKNTDQVPIENINKRFIEEVDKSGFRLQILYYNLFSVFFTQTKIEIYYENNKFEPTDYQFIIAQYYFLNNGFASNMYIVKFLNAIGIKVFNSLESATLAKNKRESLFVLSQAGLPIIPTGINFSQFFLDEQLRHFGQNRIIIKNNNGSMGYGVAVCDSQISFISTMEFIGNLHQPSNILIQPFIKANNEDYRIFVVGNKVIATMKRRAQGIEFRANVSKGGAGQAIKINKIMADLAIRAVKILGLDYAGVDIIKDDRGKMLIVEVNSNPGLKIEEATGVNVSGEIVKHCIKKSK